jgi:hypothetical protein
MKRTSAVEGRVFQAWVDGCWDVASLSEHLHLRPEVVVSAVASWNAKHEGRIDVKEKMTAEEWKLEREKLLDLAAKELPKEELSAEELANCYSTLRITITAAEIEKREGEGENNWQSMSAERQKKYRERKKGDKK